MMRKSRAKAATTDTRPAALPGRIVLGTVLLVVLGTGAWLVLRPQHADPGGGSAPNAGWNAAYRASAERIASEVAAKLAAFREAARAIAADDRAVAALRDGDHATRAGVAAALAPTLDGTLGLRLLPADTRDAELDARPPLTFASISLLRHAREDGRAPLIEAHLAGTDDEHIVVIEPVAPAGAGLLGFVHLSVAMESVREVLRETPVQNAYAEVIQSPSVRLASSGNAPAANAPALKVAIPGTLFAVRVAVPGAAAPPAGGTVEPPGGVPVALLAALAAAILVVILLLVARRRRGAAGPAAPADDDFVIYTGAIRAILDGLHPGLEQLLPRARTQGVAPADAALESLPRAVGDDITTFDRPPQAAPPPVTPAVGEGADSSGIMVSEVDEIEPVPSSVFRSYDIRGIVGDTLTEDGVYQIGRALGAEAEARGQRTVVVARDGRHSSEPFKEALCKGLIESGRDVLDIGLAPTPVLYFATHYLDARSGVMVTGSHNPPAYNGLKIVLDGKTLCGEAIQAIRRRVEEQDFIDGTGSMQAADILAEYIRRISEEIPVTLGNALRVVVDCGNAVPGAVAPDVLRAIGHDVIELYCEVDGDFPNHHPDPSQPENLAALIDAVRDEGADLGLAFDGDGDRLGVVDGEGRVFWPDRQLMLFARDILVRHPGARVIYDVKCSRRLAADISAHGGEPIMTQTGHSLIKARMEETGALLAGDLSGHIFFSDRWYGFDDAIYAAARLLEIIVNSEQSPVDLFAGLPGGITTPELRLDMPEEMHAEFMAAVQAAAQFPDGEITAIDGLRVDFPDGWGLVRPSNTTPCLVLRFEGDDEAALAAVQERFRALLRGIDDSLTLPF